MYAGVALDSPALRELQPNTALASAIGRWRQAHPPSSLQQLQQWLVNAPAGTVIDLQGQELDGHLLSVPPAAGDGTELDQGREPVQEQGLDQGLEHPCLHFSIQGLTICNGALQLPVAAVVLVDGQQVQLERLTVHGQGSSRMGLVHVSTGAEAAIRECNIQVLPGVQGQGGGILAHGHASVERCHVSGPTDACAGICTASPAGCVKASGSQVHGFHSGFAAIEGGIMQVAGGVAEGCRKAGYAASSGGQMFAGEGCVASSSGDYGFLATGRGSKLRTGPGCKAEGTAYGFAALHSAELSTENACHASSTQHSGFHATLGGKLTVGSGNRAEGCGGSGYFAGAGAQLTTGAGCIAKDTDFPGFSASAGGQLIAGARCRAQDTGSGGMEGHGFESEGEGSRLACGDGCVAVWQGGPGLFVSREGGLLQLQGQEVAPLGRGGVRQAEQQAEERAAAAAHRAAAAQAQAQQAEARATTAALAAEAATLAQQQSEVRALIAVWMAAVEAAGRQQAEARAATAEQTAAHALARRQQAETQAERAAIRGARAEVREWAMEWMRNKAQKLEMDERARRRQAERLATAAEQRAEAEVVRRQQAEAQAAAAALQVAAAQQQVLEAEERAAVAEQRAEAEAGRRREAEERAAAAEVQVARYEAGAAHGREQQGVEEAGIAPVRMLPGVDQQHPQGLPLLQHAAAAGNQHGEQEQEAAAAAPAAAAAASGPLASADGEADTASDYTFPPAPANSNSQTESGQCVHGALAIYIKEEPGAEAPTQVAKPQGGLGSQAGPAPGPRPVTQAAMSAAGGPGDRNRDQGAGQPCAGKRAAPPEGVHEAHATRGQGQGRRPRLS